MVAPETPFLQVDVGRLEANLARTARAAADAGIALRPHAKTHKCPDIARRQLAAGAVGLTVATIGEAEVFVEHGCTDVFVAYPVWLDDDRARRLRALAERATVAVGVDSAGSAANLGERVPGLAVLVEVDSGQHRTGVPPVEAGDVAAVAVAAGLDVRGVFTFPGHGYAPDGRDAAAGDEASALSVAADALRARDIEPRVLSGGSTPTLEASLATGVPTELRPGVYALNDAQQWELGSATADMLAITCEATVVSHAGGRVVLDAGGKALAADRAAYNSGARAAARRPGRADRAALRAPRRGGGVRRPPAAGQPGAGRAQPRVRRGQPRGHAVGGHRRRAGPVGGGGAGPQHLRAPGTAQDPPVPCTPCASP